VFAPPPHGVAIVAEVPGEPPDAHTSGAGDPRPR
jgi:hypothetical protein